MKHFIALLCSCLCYFFVYAQTTTTQLSTPCTPPTNLQIPINEQCGNRAIRAFNLNRFPELLEQERAVAEFTETWVANYEEAQSSLLASRQPEESNTLVIPVVIHVVYRNEVQNISMAQIMSQMEVLNLDYRRNNSDASNTPSAFAGVAADCEIEFCLAAEDPYGNPTIGITRTPTTIEEIGISVAPSGDPRIYYTALGGRDPWDPKRYLNIWVCEFNENLLGFGTNPGTGYSLEDGAVINYEYFGTEGTVSAPYHKGRTVTHEIGHYLNLEHVWGGSGGGCSQDDLVADTPMQAEAYYGCPSYPQSSCGSSDMFMNFMDYSTDGCMNLFTEGQKARMLATLNGPRADLVTGDVACHSGTLVCPYSPQEQYVQFVCDGETLVLPNDEIRASLDESNGEALGSPTADIFWYNKPILINAYNPDEINHTGDKCLPNALDTIYAAVKCVATGKKIPVGQLIFQVFPEPQAPAIIKTNNACDYSLIPACRDDEVNPSSLTTSPIGTSPGTTSITVAGNNACSSLEHTIAYPDCEAATYSCNSFSNNNPLEIPGNSLFIAYSSINISDNYLVHDINITNLDIDHYYVSDLRVSLTSPSGTILSIFDRSCSLQDDLKVQLDDDAAGPIPCPPNDGGTYWPLGSLSNFAGESMAGEWTLKVEDMRPLSGGTLNGWTMEICGVVANSVRVKAKAFLQGAYNPDTNAMRTEISEEDILPLTQPYNIAPWNYNGTETISNANAIPDNVVDWILLEVRDANNTDNVLAIKAGLLTSDGTVIDTQGSEGLEMDNLTPTQDYVLIFRHRNHLDVMGSTTVALPNANPYDFTQVDKVVGGALQLQHLNASLYALSAGDFDGNGIVLVGDINDYFGETGLINSYVSGDWSLDANVTVDDFNAFVPNASKIAVLEVRY